MLNEKKMFMPYVYTFICWTRLKTEKLLATAEQLIRKNSACCLQKRTNFFTDRLVPPLPVRFHSLFKDPSPPPDERTF